MNPSEIKEIILKVNGEQAEQEIKRIKGAIENARAEKKEVRRRTQGHIQVDKRAAETVAGTQ